MLLSKYISYGLKQHASSTFAPGKGRQHDEQISHVRLYMFKTIGARKNNMVSLWCLVPPREAFDVYSLNPLGYKTVDIPMSIPQIVGVIF